MCEKGEKEMDKETRAGVIGSSTLEWEESKENNTFCYKCVYKKKPVPICHKNCSEVNQNEGGKMKKCTQIVFNKCKSCKHHAHYHFQRKEIPKVVTRKVSVFTEELRQRLETSKLTKENYKMLLEQTKTNLDLNKKKIEEIREEVPKICAQLQELCSSFNFGEELRLTTKILEIQIKNAYESGSMEAVEELEKLLAIMKTAFKFFYNKNL
jgi:hypothetical protein